MAIVMPTAECNNSSIVSDSTCSATKEPMSKDDSIRSKLNMLENTDSMNHKELKRAANRIADAEKKRKKRAELKKDPIAYAIYLQKERDRNAKRREKLKDVRGK
ncbi:hypothetical protein BB561_006171 [Smittium simulii]|uniref:Uncharacterized protein n=1 Tax=Smittium simulii TaxID=133385 RepID=A0A2T9Y670_9FUNG|nr:hypothetical protein BB561_006171 [Smittium simulii]